MTFSNAIKRAAGKVLDFFCPRRCLVCGKLNSQGEFDYVCDACKRDLHIINGARCLVCGELVGPAESPDVRGCANCAENPPKFDACMVACAFAGAAREIIHELKYRGGTYLLKDIERILKRCRGLEEFLNGATLVPVPLHRSRRFRRRYNQSELIAQALKRAFPLANIEIENLLKRSRHTSMQAALDKSERAANIRGAFKYIDRPRFAKIPKDAKIVLIDDVITTSATLSECAAVLKKAGFKSVRAFAFARRM